MAVIRAARIAEIKPQVPEIGRIFKGAPKKLSSKGKMIFGEDLDHFRFEPDERTKNNPHESGRSLYDYLSDRWTALEKNTGGWRSLPIRFPFSRLEECFSYSNEVWATVAGKEACVRRCNGETCTKYSSENAEGKRVIVNGAIACAMKEEDAECPMGCKATGRLRFMMPALGYPGMLMLTTHSGKDIKEILANLLPYQNMDLASIPFRLFRRLDDCDRYLPDGSVQRQKKWLLHLEIDPQFGMLALEGRERKYRAELSGYQSPQLPAARAIALPPAPSRDSIMLSDEWVMFVQQVQHCITSGDSGLLNEVVVGAIAQFPAVVHEAIYREQERGVEAIRGMSAYTVQAVVAQPVAAANPVLDRLAKLREMTEHTKGQVKTLAKKAGLEIAQCAQWNEEEINRFREALFTDWLLRWSFAVEDAELLVVSLSEMDDAELFATLQEAAQAQKATVVEAVEAEF